MLKPHGRVTAALELREPDRVPTMDIMAEFGNIYEILGKRSFPLAFLFSNRYTARVLDTVISGPGTPYFVDLAMDTFTYDRTAASVRIGYDSAWVAHVPTWRFSDSKTMYDIYGRSWAVTFDGKGNLATPMYTGGLINSPADWHAWDKRPIFRMPDKNYRAYSRVQKDFGEDIFIFGSYSGGIFEIMWQSMGFERFVIAARREKEFMNRMIAFYTDLYCMIMEAQADAGLPGIVFSDDLAYRSGPMLSPGMFEELYGDSFRRLVETAHGLGMKIVIHSCGNVIPLLSWFADCGFDGVHALEPTAGIRLEEVKKLIGDRLCLIGNIDVTHILVDASRDEVHEAVRDAINEAGRGGGFMLSPTNSHQGMTVERLRWMLEAVEEFGRYPLPKTGSTVPGSPVRSPGQDNSFSMPP